MVFQDNKIWITRCGHLEDFLLLFLEFTLNIHARTAIMYLISPLQNNAKEGDYQSHNSLSIFRGTNYEYMGLDPANFLHSVFSTLLLITAPVPHGFCP